MKKILLGFSLCFFALFSVAQQPPQYTQFMVNPFLVNPALSGVDDFVDMQLGYRNQWAGFSGAPRTMYLTVHSPLNKPHHARTAKGDEHNWHGTGLAIINDQTGPTTRNYVYGNYSYNVQITPGHGYGDKHEDGIRLALGAFIGWQEYRIDAGKIETLNDLEDDLAILEAGTQKTNVLDGSLGAMFYFKDRFRIGATSQQVFGSRLEFNGLENTSRLARHYALSGEMKVDIDKGKQFYFLPSVLVKATPAAPVSVDINGRIDYKDMVFGGLSYRQGDAIAAMIGFIVDLAPDRNIHKKHHYVLELAYSYDVTVNQLRLYSNGSHEIFAGIRLPPIYRERNAEATRGRRRN